MCFLGLTPSEHSSGDKNKEVPCYLRKHNKLFLKVVLTTINYGAGRNSDWFLFFSAVNNNAISILLNATWFKKQLLKKPKTITGFVF